MNVHEFQAKQLLARYGVVVPKGKAVTSKDAAEKWVSQLDSSIYAVKAQIHAGGRGLAGGVKLTKKREEVGALAKSLLGITLVTHQTGPQGQKIRRVLIEEGVAIKKELYLSLLIDRRTGWPVFISCPEGGMDIEELAKTNPQAIHKEYIDPSSGFQPFHGRNLMLNLGLHVMGPQVAKLFRALVGNLYRFFMEKDASQVEINPLVITEDQEVIALDAKVIFDDNALARHPDVLKVRDLHEEEKLEIEASKHGLNYVKLDGTIGCMVNGAGLAMATMDLIKLAGGEPANFLDVGGGASQETVKEAFKILLSDRKVKGIFVNIFGGIVRCERIAGGIIAAAEEMHVRVPIVVRLQGTNAEQGRNLLNKSGLKLKATTDLWEGAQAVVELTSGPSKKSRAA
ncbi:MAG: ADP-forming succinate--CoA ligase subunit beta [Nitrospiraceae bacterium]|nr:ADP-forming succinate--CoA ligase subunit beta [Nitrospiraceae bacterium]|tara:strand:+ start:4227 stop:5423 length:1197 start_codon:yes stop_codon:yes gene_type:complete